MNLRNLVSHNSEKVKLPDEDVPYLGLALIVAAVQVFREQGDQDKLSSRFAVWKGKQFQEERTGRKIGPEPIDDALSWLMAIECILSVCKESLKSVSTGVEQSFKSLTDQGCHIVRESKADRTRATPRGRPRSRG
jgi:hypothetical protein